ncbi:hypothetical protein Baya_15919 [Bagarius yarrelli]|uniref:Uncharacterized protein n=1 Tax=Bagarius yarrelli TaxID=175774 RepID=A0A556VST9_BAGYA|nr:hypothetical protein Baya_15919 [Bagarius yarrelli]
MYGISLDRTDDDSQYHPIRARVFTECGRESRKVCINAAQLEHTRRTAVSFDSEWDAPVSSGIQQDSVANNQRHVIHFLRFSLPEPSTVQSTRNLLRFSLPEPSTVQSTRTFYGSVGSVYQNLLRFVYQKRFLRFSLPELSVYGSVYQKFLRFSLPEISQFQNFLQFSSTRTFYSSVYQNFLQFSLPELSTVQSTRTFYSSVYQKLSTQFRLPLSVQTFYSSVYQNFLQFSLPELLQSVYLSAVQSTSSVYQTLSTELSSSVTRTFYSSVYQNFLSTVQSTRTLVQIVQNVI